MVGCIMKKDSVGSAKQEREVVSSHNVVIDHGTSTCKAGFSTEDSPQCILPTVVGHGRHKVRNWSFISFVRKQCID